MSIFVDTSALFALLDADDAGHGLVVPAWRHGIDHDEGFVTTNYVIVEAAALAQRRLGMEAMRALADEVLPMVDTLWVSESDHATGLGALLTAGRRRVSLVDCVSFAVMRSRGIRTYLGTDPHFDEQGFTRYAPEA
jgi:predicted nucleic acid-binding protein